MIWILDTSVISELRRKKPSPNVLNWIAAIESENLWTSRVCLVEIKSGIDLRRGEENQASLLQWYQTAVLPMFESKIFEVTDDILLEWLNVLRSIQSQRGPTPPVDLLIGATCRFAKCGIATRDTSPFVACGIPTLNPFTGERFNGA